jgi:thiamine biosynthesis lipoprotein
MKKVLLLTVCSILLMGCGEQPYQHDQGFVFGTIYNITYQSADNLQTEIEAALQQVDGEFSMFNEQSTVARLNRGEQADTNAMFSEVWQLARQVSAETNGAFDITVAPLVNAWGFGFKHEQLPTARQVDSLLQVRNQMDFSAIAKGYGCDMVARLLQSRGITNYMIEIGGEVVLGGRSPSDADWHIGVNKPTADTLAIDGELFTVLNITDRAMATSGNYRNFYDKDGRRYAHTIDPRTGYPVQHSLLSATVIAANCATADAYATAFMVLGLDSARLVLQRHPELEAYLIYTDEHQQLQAWHSPTLADKIAR